MPSRSTSDRWRPHGGGIEVHADEVCETDPIIGAKSRGACGYRPSRVCWLDQAGLEARASFGHGWRLDHTYAHLIHSDGTRHSAGAATSERTGRPASYSDGHKCVNASPKPRPIWWLRVEAAPWQQAPELDLLTVGGIIWWRRHPQ
jgi:hypothetical protein